MFRDDLNRPLLAADLPVKRRRREVHRRGQRPGVEGTLDCAAVGRPERATGEGGWNLTRVPLREALVDWLASTRPTVANPPPFWRWELNAYAGEDPVEVFRAAGYVDTISEHADGPAYSSVVHGQSGYLDHALAGPGLADQVSGVTRWHVNADEPSALDYNTELNLRPARRLLRPGRLSLRRARPAARRPRPRRTAGRSAVRGGRPPLHGGRGPVAHGGGGREGPRGAALTYRWDLDGDGTYETAGRSATFSAATLQAPASRMIGVRAVDPAGTRRPTR